MKYWAARCYKYASLVEEIGLAIGIYDSGLGGLSVWRELRKRTASRLVYFGDTAHLPYGEKSPEQLLQYFSASLAFFQSRGCRSLVVACNTTSAVVLPKVKPGLTLPVYGMIEGAEAALIEAEPRKVGVLATRATAASGVYQTALAQALPGVEVVVQSAPELVPLVEQGKLQGPEVEAALSNYLNPLIRKGIDTLLLGCTHYPFLSEEIQKIVGRGIRLVDPAPAVARQAQGVAAAGQGETEFWVSAQPQKFQVTAELILGERVSPVRLYPLDEE